MYVPNKVKMDPWKSQRKYAETIRKKQNKILQKLNLKYEDQEII